MMKAHTSTMNEILTFNQVTKRFRHYLQTMADISLNPENYSDSDDADAMISDVIGFLQVQLSKRGCTLIAYSVDNIPIDEYSILGRPIENTLTQIAPRCINPRQPIYTEKKY